MEYDLPRNSNSPSNRLHFGVRHPRSGSRVRLALRLSSPPLFYDNYTNIGHRSPNQVPGPNFNLFQTQCGHMPENEQSGNSLAEYRQWIVAAEQKSQDDFDKTILSLAAGGLGISIIFLKDIVGSNPLVWPTVLVWSWGLLIASILFILMSFFLSHLALRYTIICIDSDKLDFKNPGGRYGSVTRWFNALGALFFVLGISLLITFAFKNFPNQGVKNGKTSPATSDSKAPIPPTAGDSRLHPPSSTASPTSENK